MNRGRWIVVNLESQVIDGLYLCQDYAERAAGVLRETWPVLNWEVQATTEPYPQPGRVCTGHLKAARILKSHMPEAAQ